MTTYSITKITAQNGNFQSMLPAIDQAIDRPNVFLWGRFYGLFGLASNELIVVTYGDVNEINAELNSHESIQNASSLLLLPTARPITDERRTKEGLYVFRTFDVDHKDVDEIAELSKNAWVYFETSREYSAEPQALFCQADRSKDQGIMLLVTWYDGLTSWQTSRQPPGQAGENFRRRAQLTHRTQATATRLLSD